MSKWGEIFLEEDIQVVTFSPDKFKHVFSPGNEVLDSGTCNGSQAPPSLPSSVPPTSAECVLNLSADRGAQDEHEGVGSSEGQKNDNDEVRQHLAKPLSLLQQHHQVAGNNRRRFDSADWAMDVAGVAAPVRPSPVGHVACAPSAY
jgi:hypothetical protein